MPGIQPDHPRISTKKNTFFAMLPVVFSLHGDGRESGIGSRELTAGHSLLRLNSFDAAFLEGNNEASRAITNTVAPTSKKSFSFKVTGK